MVDRIAKERLFAHIYDHRSELPSAYRQLNILGGRQHHDPDHIYFYGYLLNPPCFFWFLPDPPCFFTFYQIHPVLKKRA
jgi:hypothetical protein